MEGGETYLASLWVNVGKCVFPPVLIEGLLLLALQGLGIIILIHTVLGENIKIRFDGKQGTKKKQSLSP